MQKRKIHYDLTFLRICIVIPSFTRIRKAVLFLKIKREKTRKIRANVVPVIFIAENFFEGL